MLHDKFIDDVSAVHTTASHSRERLTGSNYVNEIFFHQVPSTSNARHSLTSSGPFSI